MFIDMQTTLELSLSSDVQKQKSRHKTATYAMVAGV